MGNNCFSRKDDKLVPYKFNDEYKQSIYCQIEKIRSQRQQWMPKSSSNCDSLSIERFQNDEIQFNQESKEKYKLLEQNIIQSQHDLEQIFIKKGIQDKLVVSDHNLSIKEIDSLSFQLAKQMEEIIKINRSSLDQTGWEQILNETKADHGLKVFAKQFESGNSSSKVNLTKSEWCVPCTPRQFIDFMNNIEIQKSLDRRIDVFLAYEKNEVEKEYKMYLSYKGFFLVSPRDFVYAKKIKQIDLEKNIWCDVSCSSEDFLYPPHPSKVRGEIIQSGHYVQPLSFYHNVIEQKERFLKIKDPENWSLVRLYSHCDFKMNLPLAFAKSSIAGEMKNYIEKCINYLKIN